MGQGYSTVIQNFLRIYIVAGFIVAILLNVYIIRLLQKTIDLIEANKALLTQSKDTTCHQASQPSEEPGRHAKLLLMCLTAQTQDGNVPGEFVLTVAGGSSTSIKDVLRTREKLKSRW